MEPYLDYAVWKDDNKRILESLSDRKVFMTYSGGKDSSLILHFLQNASEEFHFNFETHAIPFPSNILMKEIDKLNRYWEDRGIIIMWHDVSVSDIKLTEALDQKVSPCLICNQTKKNVLRNYLRDSDLKLSSAVIVMNYSLWDLVSATIEHILGEIYSDKKKSNMLQGKKPEERFIEISQRFYPLLTISNGPTIIKPLIKYNDQEILNSISTYNIPIASTKCEFNLYRPKRWFATYYNSMGLQFSYDDVFNFAKKAFNLPDISYYERLDIKKYLKSVL